jgi:hypothetical protein
VLQADLQVGQFPHQLDVVGQELVQGRIDQADDDRQAVHGPKQPGKILPLKGQQASRASRVRWEDRS